MKSRAWIKVFIFSILGGPLTMKFSNAEDEPPSATPQTHLDQQNKLLLECQHPDYRTYIKCLKRQKRHHWHNNQRAESDGGETKNCFDECGMDTCESTKCVHDCHKQCMKKTKETRQIITQYETTCVSDDCTENSEKKELPAAAAATNVTTNIDVNNVINNHISKTLTEHEPKQRPCAWTNFGCGLSLVPQVQFVPQITFGLSTNSFGGGYWPNSQPNGIDCSACGNPLMRYRCDLSCYSVQAGSSGSSLPNSSDSGTVGGINPNCIAPRCVGGGIPSAAG